MGARRRTPQEILERNLIPEPNSGCWLWIGGLNRGGYGVMPHRKNPGREITAHRQAWVNAYGPIPSGLFVCHHCDVRSCANPAHLFLGTSADNMQDASRKGRLVGHNSRKTHCPAGHDYDAANTRFVPQKDGTHSRQCKICVTKWQRDKARAARSPGPLRVNNTTGFRGVCQRASGRFSCVITIARKVITIGTFGTALEAAAAYDEAALRSREGWFRTNAARGLMKEHSL